MREMRAITETNEYVMKEATDVEVLEKSTVESYNRTVVLAVVVLYGVTCTMISLSLHSLSLVLSFCPCWFGA